MKVPENLLETDMDKSQQPKVYTEEEAKLVPEIREWNEGGGIRIQDWISCVGSYEHAIGYCTLFWPKFVLHDGCLLRDGFTLENYEGFLVQTNRDKQAVESVMNHFHLTDLFPHKDDSPTKEQLIFLGRVLKEMWQAKVQSEFPELKVTVHFKEKNIEWPLDYMLTVYQERN